MHVHTVGEGGEAKFWLRPVAHVAWSEGLGATTLRELTAEVQRQSALIERAWNEYFGT
jgi:hypothetical protein